MIKIIDACSTNNFAAILAKMWFKYRPLHNFLCKIKLTATFVFALMSRFLRKSWTLYTRQALWDTSMDDKGEVAR